MSNIIQNSALSTLVERALPTKSEKVKFNLSSNMYETDRYVSASGNAYFRGIKLSERVVLEFCCGDGWFHRFINEIRVYCFNGTSRQLIGARSYYNQFYSDSFCHKESVDMISRYLKDQAQLIGGAVDDATIIELSKQLVETTNQRLLS